VWAPWRWCCITATCSSVIKLYDYVYCVCIWLVYLSTVQWRICSHCSLYMIHPKWTKVGRGKVFLSLMSDDHIWWIDRLYGSLFVIHPKCLSKVTNVKPPIEVEAAICKWTTAPWSQEPDPIPLLDSFWPVHQERHISSGDPILEWALVMMDSADHLTWFFPSPQQMQILVHVS
jgi:hypothetical protein